MSMNTKELIYEAIERVDEERLDELYALIRQFAQPKKAEKPDFLNRLSRIQIDAPEDFATNVDLYISGEKSVEPIKPKT